MPEQRGTVGRFTDDAPVSKSRLIEAELPQSWKGPGMGEELSQYGVLVGHVPVDHDHAAGRSIFLKMLRLLPGKHFIAEADQPIQQGAIADVFEYIKPVTDELVSVPVFMRRVLTTERPFLCD
jgi:hypothetical protein